MLKELLSFMLTLLDVNLAVTVGAIIYLMVFTIYYCARYKITDEDFDILINKGVERVSLEFEPLQKKAGILWKPISILLFGAWFLIGVGLASDTCGDFAKDFYRKKDKG